MLDTLNREDRLQLMRFVCSFAWADLEVTSEEREFIVQLVDRLELDDEERKEEDMVERRARNERWSLRREETVFCETYQSQISSLSIGIFVQ